jgi:hypothetical protein
MTPKSFKPAVIAAAIATLCMPLAAQTASPSPADVAARIEALTQELQALKAQVQAQQKAAQESAQQAAAVQAKQAEQVQALQSQSLGSWLTVGGDYQFRMDSLRGETRPFTDVTAVFANAQNQLQGAFFANPTPANGAMLTGLMGFARHERRAHLQPGADLSGRQFGDADGPGVLCRPGLRGQLQTQEQQPVQQPIRSGPEGAGRRGRGRESPLHDVQELRFARRRCASPTAAQPRSSPTAWRV